MKEEKIGGCNPSGCAGCSGCSSYEEELDFDPTITLTDEKGVDVKFEILDVVVLEDERQFLVVSEVEQEENEEGIEVLILEIKEEDGEEVYDTVIDKELAEKVFALFQKQQENIQKSIQDLEEDVEK